MSSNSVLDENLQLASLFESVANLLQYQGEGRFKVVAYLKAARTLRSLDRPIRELSPQALESLPGIGKAILAKTAEFLECGSFPLHDRLTQDVPAGIRELIGTGLGPSSVRSLQRGLGINSPADLAEAISVGDQRLSLLPKRLRDEIQLWASSMG